jgi:DNA-binding response OmpR family regulator
MAEEKILVVDDEAIVRMAVKDLLEDEGYRVSIAPTGEDGIEKVKSNIFDLVLLDLKLPGKDGIEVLREIKGFNNSPAVIMMTGYASLETAKDAIRTGAFDYITKPIDPEELMPVIRDALKRKGMPEAKELSKN